MAINTRYYNATEYIKERNERRKEKGQAIFNLSNFLNTNKKIKELVLYLKGKGIEPIIVTQGNKGETQVCEEVFNAIRLAENPMLILRVRL